MEANVWDVTELRRLLCWARGYSREDVTFSRVRVDSNGNRLPELPKEEFNPTEADKIRAKSLGVIL
jgi:hypothetical protein